MFARACLLAVGTALLLPAGAAGEEAEARPAQDATASREAAPQHGDSEAARPLLHWGIPESPFPVLEEERKLFGFHFRFEFGRSEAPRRGYRVR